MKGLPAALTRYPGDQQKYRFSSFRSLGPRTFPLYVKQELLYATETVRWRMIKSYRDKKTQQFAAGERVREFEGFRHQAEKRLEILDAAQSLETLRHLRSNRFEALLGDRTGQYSIRINLQWRICFAWPSGEDGPSNVEIVDYH